jgi:hypothetical protein
MKLTLSTILSCLAAIPVASAWGIGFYYDDTCTPPEPAAYGDETSHGCTTLDTPGLHSASSNLDDNPDVFHLIVYENNDCTGASCDLYQAQNMNCCKTSNTWQSFRTA